MLRIPFWFRDGILNFSNKCQKHYTSDCSTEVRELVKYWMGGLIICHIRPVFEYELHAKYCLFLWIHWYVGRHFQKKIWISLPLKYIDQGRCSKPLTFRELKRPSNLGRLPEQQNVFKSQWSHNVLMLMLLWYRAIIFFVCVGFCGEVDTVKFISRFVMQSGCGFDICAG